ncbi:MAG: hypothetical protein K2P78_04550 [Gemmataceae bacterium]|nr:hypothetical protein [Gemmataceae bacterium]
MARTPNRRVVLQRIDTDQPNVKIKTSLDFGKFGQSGHCYFVSVWRVEVDDGWEKMLLMAGHDLRYPVEQAARFNQKRFDQLVDEVPRTELYRESVGLLMDRLGLAPAAAPVEAAAAV